jgi:hypothetical protein
VNLLALRLAYEFGGNSSSSSLVVIGGCLIVGLTLVRGTADKVGMTTVHEFTHGHSHFFVTNLIYQSPKHESVILSLVTLPNLYWPSSLSSLLYLPSLSVQELDLACELQSTRNDQKDPLSVHTDPPRTCP